MRLSPALRFLSESQWAMEPEIFARFASLLERHANGDRQPRLADDEAAPTKAQPREPGFQLVGRVGVLPVRGVISRYADQVNGICQDQGRSHEALQADLRLAARHPDVAVLLLRLDSPGGTVAGTAETARLLREIKASGKSVLAYIDGMAASAAYWIAAQADEIIASSETAIAGSIGVITAHVDETAYQEKQGFKVHVLRSVALKAPGSMGESLNDEQLASINRRLADTHAAFSAAVGSARRLSAEQLAAVATGEAFNATRAQALGLIDRVGDLDRILAQLNAGHAFHPAARAAIAAAVHPSASKETPMDKTQLKALLAAHAAHAALINECDDKGLSETETRAKIAEAVQAAEVADLKAQTVKATEAKAAAEAALEKAKAEHASALKAEQTAHAETKAQLAKAQKVADLGGSAPKDVGGSPTPTAKEQDPLAEANLKARWESDEKLRESFGGVFEGLLALAKDDKELARQALGLQS
jgi:signal peptide peptidase SppA